MADLPSAGTLEYLWWSQGAADEAKARDEGMNAAAIDVRATLEAYAMGLGKDVVTAEDVVTFLARVYCPERLRRRHRG